MRVANDADELPGAASSHLDDGVGGKEERILGNELCNDEARYPDENLGDFGTIHN